MELTFADLFTCRNDAERGRLLDLSRRMRLAELRSSYMLGAAAIMGIPCFGLMTALLPLPVLGTYWIVQLHLDRFRRPERILLVFVLMIQAALTASIAVARGPGIFLLPLLMLAVLISCIVFPARIAVLVTSYSGILMVGVTALCHMSELQSTPFALLYPLAVMISTALTATVIAGLDVRTRGSATLDPLTELPNRMALLARAAELEHQSRGNGRPVALLVADPDGFKAINDNHGHAVGDAVLRGVAARLRSVTHGGASVYRLGGEEFVVLIGDADENDGLELAETMRKAIIAEPIEALQVAISIGVAASQAGTPFAFGAVFGDADNALYAAKGAGGDAVAGALSGCRRTSDAARLRSARGSTGGRSAKRPTSAQAHLLAVAAESGPDGPRGSSAARPAAAASGGGAVAQRTAEGGWESWKAREHAATGNWLIKDDMQREQLLELNRRLRAKAKPGFLLGFTVGGASAIQYGWQILIPTGLLAVVYIVTEHRLEHARHPEFALGAAWLGLETSFFLAALIANSPMIFAGSLLYIILIGSAAVFPPRGVVIGVLYCSAIISIVPPLTDMPLLEEAPGLLALMGGLGVSVGMVGATLGRSTIDYRDMGIVDQLTGLFNRMALLSRVAELAHRSTTREAPVAVLVADVDNFKAINDNHGHAVGDEVLRTIGERMRANLRAFESAYRVGGEEFVVLLDEIDWRRAEMVAARLCKAIAEQPIAGIEVTISAGLAASAPGESFDYDSVFRRADTALYEAKHSGGNHARAARRMISGSAAGDGGAQDGESRAISIAPIATSVPIGV